ncbi:hypothetical protein FRC09_019247, partial [Ceratobasidium sp. 395]
MDSVIVNNDKELSVATSISILDEFLEAQRRSLDKLRDDIQRLEELKSQATVEPVRVFETAINDPNQSYLKHSEACSQLDVGVPNLDWSLFAQAGDNNPSPKTLLCTQNSRASRIRSEIASLNRSLSALPALPSNLLDTTESKVKKRKRTGSPPTSKPLYSSTQSGGLRLLAVTPNHNTPAQLGSASNMIPQLFEPYQRSTPSTNSSSGPQEPFTPMTPLDSTAPLYLDCSHTPRRTWASKDINTHYATIQSTSSSRPSSPMSGVEFSPEAQLDNNDTEPAEEKLPCEPPSEELPASFKKNWTLDEQHTLERLLTEIPSTVKFRWVKISEAMGGTRTPRQVASR